MNPYPALAVTTSADPLPTVVVRARALAEAWGLPFVTRPRKGAASSLVGVQAERLLVLGGEGVALWDKEGVLAFSLGMAQLRIKRIDRGLFDDALVRWGELRSGDTVLDCTLGLAADALVASRAVGPTGRVVGLEKSIALCALVAEGARRYARAGWAPLEVIHSDALAYLQTQGEGAFDCVLFDPMFDRPRRASHAFDGLRRHADYAPLTAQMLNEGRRVARRWVVVKGARYSHQWANLGLVPEPASRHASVVWARVPALLPRSKSVA